MPLDYTVHLTLCDKYNRVTRRRPFTASRVYHDSGIWSRPFAAEAHVRFHASPCSVCVGLSSSGTKIFSPFACIAPITDIPVTFHIHSFPH